MSSITGGLMVPAAPVAPVQTQTTAGTIVERVLSMVKRDLRFGDYRHHYSSFEREVIYPYALVLVESMSSQGMGINRIREEFMLRVSLARSDPRKADAPRVYADFENFRSLLHERPRLEDLENVDLAECVGMTPFFGETGNYMVASAEIKVKIQMHKIG